MAKRNKVTMEQLAAQLGLSRLTVSKALKGQAGMSEETRRTVLELAEKSGYRTKAQTEADAVENTGPSSPARRFAFVMAGEQAELSEIHMKLLRGLHDRYQPLRHQVVPLFMPESFEGKDSWTDWQEDSGLAHYDGLFIPPMLKPVQERMLLALGLPRILLNYPRPGTKADSVIWDSYDLVRQAVHRLLSEGRRNILFVGNMRLEGLRLRWAAFRDEMEEAGLPAREENHVTTPIHDRDRWQAVVSERIRSIKPDAIVSAIEHELPWIVYLCGREGIRLPEDCVVAGLDHAEDGPGRDGVALYYLPVLETGRRAAELMLWRIAHPAVPYEHIRIQGRSLPDKPGKKGKPEKPAKSLAD
ncbi:LacI family DNA-binding transcriptional regulator [Cohnella rhizosphaerae]|uniref:LacI family transcriptional regulator n=1 Tax=Cohnella rhizosphaerae TaxID=1457232 RepID=A0A9X4KQ58_9BACL|nr:LacI family DNA-binding transcriptional regulator [Cohnella rhizosphaerae]MDG0808478.1 LacI family transcriptional regulator [Cohnella rhizosphaerae]